MFTRQNNAEVLYLCKEKATNLVSAWRQASDLYVNLGVMSFAEHVSSRALITIYHNVIPQGKGGVKRK
ncbi:hypothetical protein HH682_08270 [Rosenbergiella sp. S61]|uniref:Uncharacterized protein n=1 Tax=Rosenbergiella gaditana TaxID=2726987 RepID=A0ABS5SWE7_9GAMM|nr:hypothetical protein [Rosenbergiella gaditana]MBT0724434.1 hypothetical protein [Rosenbergiella gaditana]